MVELNDVSALFSLLSVLFFFVGFYFYLVIPLFFQAVSYSDFASLEISLLDEVLFDLLLIDIGMCLMTRGGWLEDVLTYNKRPLGFLYGRYVLFVMLNVTSQKSAILRFALISILNPISLKIFITFFLIRSVFSLLALRNNIKITS